MSWVSAILKDTRDGTLYFRLLGDPTQVYRVGEDHRFVYRTESSVLAEEDLLVKTVQEDIPQGDGRGPGGLVTGRELDLHLRPYARPGFLLRDDAGVHVYNESYAYLGTLGAQSPKISEPREVQEPVWDDLPEQMTATSLTQQTVYLDPSLVFDIELGGRKYAQRMTGGFFILISPEGEEVFEYYTSDRFMGPHPEGNCLVFRNPVTGETYGKAMDGRRVELSGTATPPEEPGKPAPPPRPPAGETTPPAPPPPPKEQVVHLLKRMVQALKQHGISADYFVQKTYRTERVPDLLKVMEGDLRSLNGDLSEMVPQPEKAGLTFLKAGLIHELYINTTLDGRGGHRGKGMKAFLLEMVLCREDGTLDQDQRAITVANRERFLAYLQGNMGRWAFLQETLKRVFAHWKADEEFLALGGSEDPVRMGFFKAFLISKIYEYTTRLERGNGAEMIDLVRLVLDVR